jgi:UDP-glucuronate 4-epimerase
MVAQADGAACPTRERRDAMDGTTERDRQVWLVTGAAGFIGGHLVRRLLDEGETVVGIDNLNDYYDPALKKARLHELAHGAAFHFEHGDVTDPELLEALCARHGVARVVHLAAQAGVRWSLEAPMAYVSTNVGGTTAVFEAARRTGVEHVVYASSSSVYGETSMVPFSVHQPADHPVSVYAATKRATELLAHTFSHLYDLPTTGLRFFTVYGPWGRPDMAYYAFAQAILRDEPIHVFGDGTQLRDMTYVDDVIEGVVRSARLAPERNPDWVPADAEPSTAAAPFRVHNIGHGGQVTLNRMIELLEACLGRRARREDHPRQPGDVLRTHADASDLVERIGYLPTTPIEVGIGRFADWFLDHHA